MVFGLFSKERKIERAKKKAMNRLAQQVDRWAAMERLRDHGDEDALYTLCRRWTFTSTKLPEDEQEKEWVVEVLLSKGPAALNPLRRYLKNNTAVSYALRVLGGITGPEKVLESIDEILEDEEPGYTRDPEKRIDIINWLAEYEQVPNEEVVKRVAPYLADRDENTRYAAVDAIDLRPSPEGAEPLVTALLRKEEESRRLKVRIGETLANHEMDLCGRKNDVAELFDDILSDYRLHRNKLVRKKV